MKYKALFLDVDGTTVIHGVDNLPTSRVSLAVKRAMKHGVSVGLATSRPPHVVMRIIEHLRLNGCCVLSSGSQIYDPQQKKMILRKDIPQGAIPHIVEAARKYAASVNIYDGKNGYVYEGGVPGTVIGMYFPQITPSILQQISEELRMVEGIALHRMEAWDTRYECLDIVHKEASKAYGVKEAARIMGVTTEEIIGIGDGYNDLPLFEACGLKIAMGNAVSELKAMADFVAPTVEEDGVAVAINKFILS